MKSCKNCGAENEDFATNCAYCGNKFYSATPPITRKKKSFPKAIIAVGAVAILLGSGLAAWLELNPSAKVKHAFKETFRQLGTAISEKSELDEAVNTASVNLKSGKYEVELVLDSELYFLDAKYGYSKRKHIVSGHAQIEYPAADFTAEVEYAANKKSLQIASPKNSFNVYGFQFKDLSKRINNSALNSILPMDIPSSFNLDNFDLSKTLKSFGSKIEKQWRIFYKTIEIKKEGKSSIKVADDYQECTIYRVSWDKDSLDDYAKNVVRELKLPGSSETILKLIQILEPDCLLYVNSDDVIVAVDCVAAGNRYLFTLQGKENVWDDFSLKTTSLNGAETEYRGAIKRNGNVTAMILARENETLLAAQYDNRTGQYSIQTHSLGIILAGQIQGEDGRAYISTQLLPDLNPEFKVAVAVSDLPRDPELISKNYIDVFNLSAGEIQRIIMDIGLALTSAQ